MKKFEEQYYKHISGEEKAEGAYAIVFDILEDLKDRRGLRQSFEWIDDETQDEIVETWISLTEKHIEIKPNTTK